MRSWLINAVKCPVKMVTKHTENWKTVMLNIRIIDILEAEALVCVDFRESNEKMDRGVLTASTHFKLETHNC